MIIAIRRITVANVLGDELTRKFGVNVGGDFQCSMDRMYVDSIGSKSRGVTPYRRFL